MSDTESFWRGKFFTVAEYAKELEQKLAEKIQDKKVMRQSMCKLEQQLTEVTDTAVTLATQLQDTNDELAEAEARYDTWVRRDAILQDKLTLAIEALEHIANEDYGRPSVMMSKARHALNKIRSEG